MSVVAWALGLFIGLACAIMPPLNLVTVPAFLMLASGVVGAIAHRIDEAKAACGSSSPVATRVAPPVSTRHRNRYSRGKRAA